MAFKPVNGGASANSKDVSSGKDAIDLLGELGGETSEDEGDVSEDGSEDEADSSVSDEVEGVDGTEIEDELDGNGPVELEVKGDGKTVKFKLDPQDAQLKRTLEWGMAAPRFVRERKQARQELDEVKKSMAPLSEKAAKHDELEELKVAGRFGLAVKAFLGEENYKKFYSDAVLKRVKYDTAESDEERRAIEKQFMEEDHGDKLFMADRDKGKLKSQLDSATSEQQARFQRSLATAEHARYRFDEFDSNPATQEAMSGKLWKLAMADIEEWISAKKADGIEVVPSKEHYRKAFQENYKFLVGKKASAPKKEAEANKKTQQEQKKKAANVAKAGNQKADKKKFDSLNVLDRFDFIKNLG